MRLFNKFLSVIFLMFLTLPMNAHASQALKAEEIGSLVDDKTWHMRFEGAEGSSMYWVWHRDGTVCARWFGSGRKDNDCHDDGRWRLDGDLLCWKLTWLGGSTGLMALRGSFRGKQPCSEMLRVVAALGGLTHNMTDFVSLH